MYDVIIKRGDTRNCMKAVLKGANGSVVDLTGCAVRFLMAPFNRPPNRLPTIDREAHIEDAGNGEVWMVWAPGETDAAGFYQAEFEVTYQDGKRETFPNNGYISLLIQNDLG